MALEVMALWTGVCLHWRQSYFTTQGSRALLKHCKSISDSSNQSAHCSCNQVWHNYQKCVIFKMCFSEFRNAFVGISNNIWPNILEGIYPISLLVHPCHMWQTFLLSLANQAGHIQCQTCHCEKKLWLFQDIKPDKLPDSYFCCLLQPLVIMKMLMLMMRKMLVLVMTAKCRWCGNGGVVVLVMVVVMVLMVFNDSKVLRVW